MEKTYEKLSMLPMGRITAKGWIREQLLRSKNGMGGRLDEIEPLKLATPYITRELEDAWGRYKVGWCAETSGTYWQGLMELAFGLDDAELKAKASAWIKGTLAIRGGDGYWGVYTKNDNMYEDFNAVGTGRGLMALQAYYEATGDAEVLDTIHRCLLWFCENWAGDKKSQYAGVFIVCNMAWCYKKTGDERLRVFIDEYFDFLNRNDLFLNSINTMLSPDVIYNSNHAGAVAYFPGIAASGYMACGKKEYLKAAQNLVKKIRKKLLLPTGGLSTNTEYISPIAANTETELCCFAYFHDALINLGAVTGDPQYYDISERAALNGSQGARKKDEKAVAYFTSGNQIFATKRSDLSGGETGVYTPCFPTICCGVNSIRILPEYLRGMALIDGNGGAYISVYGPARINFGGLVFETDTAYPFRDTIEYSICADGGVEKTVHFRIPSWCEGASVSVNGKEWRGEKEPCKWFAVKRRWNTGDTVRLCLPMRVKISRLNDADSWKHYPLVVEYGPLLFSLPIPEVWQIVEGRPRKEPLPEGWGWYQVTPGFNDAGADPAVRFGMRKYYISWNAALDENVDVSLIKVEKHEGGYVWENPQITLTLPGHKALHAYAPYLQNTQEVSRAPIDVYGGLELKLVPYGCTALRISYFPRAGKRLADGRIKETAAFGKPYAPAEIKNEKLNENSGLEVKYT